MDLAGTRLLRDQVDLELRPQAFRVLKVLVENPGRLVTYAQLIDEAWNRTRVSHHTIAVTLSEVKLALAECGHWITCRARFGYSLEIPDSEKLLRTGTHFRNQFTGSGFENALRRFQQAAQNDTADSRLAGAVANTHLNLAAFLLRAPRDVYPEFLEAYDRAVAMHGLTLDVKVDRAFARYIFEGDLATAETELREALEKRPGSADIYQRLAIVYAAGGRLDAALALMQQPSEIDLLLPPFAFVETLLRLYRREFDLAIACGEQARDLHPGTPFGRVHYAEALEHAGRLEEARQEYRIVASMSPDVPWIRAQGARFLAKIGRADEATQILWELQQDRARRYVDAYHLALLLLALGRAGEAYQELERAFQERSCQLLVMDVDPKADVFREDSRFASFRSKAHGRVRSV
jgi:DNA-binding winged helix-turn-helix (wHTH) protein/Tfp pilus assembly protein PilF